MKALWAPGGVYATDRSTAVVLIFFLFEPQHDKPNNVAVRPANSDQPGHPPSLISLPCALSG